MISLVYSIILSCWRRWFGGGFPKLPDNRFLQHLIGFLMAFCSLYFTGHHWIQCILAGLCLQGLYWARSHGCCFDFGHGQPPDVSRYEQLWYWKYIKKIIPEKEWYSFTGDYILMVARYTLPSILIAIILLSIPFIFSGIVVGSVYALMWYYKDWNIVDKPTELAEYIIGFTTGLLLVL